MKLEVKSLKGEKWGWDFVSNFILRSAKVFRELEVLGI